MWGIFALISGAVSSVMFYFSAQVQDNEEDLRKKEIRKYFPVWVDQFGRTTTPLNPTRSEMLFLGGTLGAIICFPCIMGWMLF
jgi:hypothetical protein